MNAPPKLSIIEQIRARDGSNCWLCDGKLDFSAKGNSKKAPTKEHLVPQSLGGGNELSNLVLCHPGCNRQLRDFSLEKKLKIRAKMAANRAQVTAKRPGVSLAAEAAAPQTARTPKKTDPRIDRLAAQLWRWQLFGLVSAGMALLMIGLVTGLLLAR